VRGAIFSITPPAPDGDDSSYLRWHLLDHMPEQYQLPGMVHALRWIADDDHRAARLAGAGPLADTGNVVCYLVAEPVQQTHDEFVALGRQLAEAGRYPQRRPSLHLRLLELLSTRAAPAAGISDGVVPFRPHRGVLFVVEQPVADTDAWLRWLDDEHEPALNDVPGVAGVCLHGSTDRWVLDPRCQGEPEYVTVVYLDGDPLATAAALTPLVEQRWSSGAVRPLFAGPLRSMVRWDAWPTSG
jgi:hypothetical protein